MYTLDIPCQHIVPLYIFYEIRDFQPGKLQGFVIYRPNTTVPFFVHCKREIVLSRDERACSGWEEEVEILGLVRVAEDDSSYFCSEVEEVDFRDEFLPNDDFSRNTSRGS